MKDGIDVARQRSLHAHVIEAADRAKKNAWDLRADLYLIGGLLATPDLETLDVGIDWAAIASELTALADLARQNDKAANLVPEIQGYVGGKCSLCSGRVTEAARGAGGRVVLTCDNGHRALAGPQISEKRGP